jgi:hypothetical protein
LLTGAEPKLLGAGEPNELDEPKPPDEDWPYAGAPPDDVFPKPFDDPPNPVSDADPPNPPNELAGPGGLLVAAICGNLPVSIISSSSIFGMINSLYVC